MATMATYRGIDPVTIIAGTTGNVTIPRGARCALSTDGTNICYLAGATVRGDYVAMQDIFPGAAGAAVRLGAGGEIVVLNGADPVTAGATLYAGANGLSTPTAGTVILGKAREAATANVLFGALLENPL